MALGKSAHTLTGLEGTAATQSQGPGVCTRGQVCMVSRSRSASTLGGRCYWGSTSPPVLSTPGLGGPHISTWPSLVGFQIPGGLSSWPHRGDPNSASDSGSPQTHPKFQCCDSQSSYPSASRPCPPLSPSYCSSHPAAGSPLHTALLGTQGRAPAAPGCLSLQSSQTHSLRPGPSAGRCWG